MKITATQKESNNKRVQIERQQEKKNSTKNKLKSSKKKLFQIRNNYQRAKEANRQKII